MLSKAFSLTKAAAWRIVGGLSRTTKMPCWSWGLPAKRCKVGGQLANKPGTVCHGCYALKGAYAWSNVERAYERRFEHASSPEWVPAMVKLVHWQAKESGAAFFRWFDSGDLQSVEMLQRIAEVARWTPDIRHWLPTREHGIVRRYLDSETPPANLVIRLSALRVDSDPPELLGLPTSTVHADEAPRGYECPAYDVTPASCGSCRACWDGDVANVSYRFH